MFCLFSGSCFTSLFQTLISTLYSDFCCISRPPTLGLLFLNILDSVTSRCRIGSREGRTFFRDFAYIMQWSHASEVSMNLLGSRACFKVLEGTCIVFNWQYVFSHFSGTFSSNFSIYIYVDILQNIYFYTKIFCSFCKCIISFVEGRNSKFFVFV